MNKYTGYQINYRYAGKPKSKVVIGNETQAMQEVGRILGQRRKVLGVEAVNITVSPVKTNA